MDPELTDEQKAAIEAELREKLEDELKQKFQSENEEIIEKIAEERLAKMKANMDKMDKQLKDTIAENTRWKDKAKEAERKRLEDEGKHLELAEMKNAELKEQVKLLEEKLTGLTRDRTVEKAISSLEFRNDFARETAFNAIVNQLEQTSEGDWRHKSGASIEDYIKVFVKDERHEILFKPKSNSGTGANPSGTGKPKSTKSITEMSTLEMLEAAERGDLGNFSF